MTTLSLLLICLWAGGVLAAPPPPVNSGGSLVLSVNEAKPPLLGTAEPKSVLGQEVQAFIFRHHSRVWPEVTYLRPRMGGRSFYQRLPLSSPALEPLIQKYARFYGVEEHLIRAVIRHESGGNNRAVSPKGAQGLMQLMPGTASLMGVRDPFDPEENIAGGVGYLRRCLDRFGQNIPLAVAAYNAGPERVAQYGAVPPIAETQSFVRNVMGSYLGQQPLGTLAKTPSAPGRGPTVKAAPEPRGTRKVSALAERDRPSRRLGPKIIEVRFPKKTVSSNSEP
jgi:hypothetical protein